MLRSAAAFPTQKFAPVLVGVLSLLAAFALADTPDPSLAPATVDPLPPGWKASPFDLADVKAGSNSDLDARFELTSEVKATTGPLSLPDWAKLHQTQDAKDSAMTNRHETDLKPAKLGAHDTLQYEVTGDLYGSSLHYHVFFMGVRGVYCEVDCWVNSKNWDAAKGQFDQIASNVK